MRVGAWDVESGWVLEMYVETVVSAPLNRGATLVNISRLPSRTQIPDNRLLRENLRCLISLPSWGKMSDVGSLSFE